MKKILMIIFMYIIASNSYYGLVNEKGEKITDFQNTENIITTEQTQEQKDETVVNTEEIQQEQIEQKDTTKNEIEKNTIDDKNTKQESKQNKDKKTTEKNEVIPTDNKSNNTKNQTDEKNNTSTNTNTNTNTNNNNKCEHGDEGWYNTKAEAKAVYDNEVSSLDEQWESGKISTEEYRAKKPNGCEVWDCAECHKWTVSIY